MAVAIAAVISLLAARPLLDWRPTDIRRIVVTYREGLAPFVLVIMAMTVIQTAPHAPNNVIIGRAPARPRKTIAWRQIAETSAAVSIGLAVGMAAPLIRASIHKIYGTDILALLGVFCGLFMATCVSYAACLLFRFPYSALGGPLLSGALLGIPIFLNDVVLNNTGYSTLASSLTWGMTSPEGAWDFSASVAIYRVALFCLTGACMLNVALAVTDSGLPLVRRLTTSAVNVAVPVILITAMTLLSPNIVVPSQRTVTCTDQDKIRVCTFPGAKSLQTPAIEAARQVLAQVPKDHRRSLAMTQDNSPDAVADIWLPPVPSSDPQAFRAQVAADVARVMAGSPACPLSSSHLASALELDAVLRQRSGFSPENGTNSPLADIPKRSFEAWWKSHDTKIMHCQLTAADLGQK
ncbi:hypothetical protein FYJ43_06575 [Cutibacterium sp. WCA-380-WT-3A]|uniref:Uncharacterized protein n=1 Tax=Cutibacterium porci TaxID=2605781 RepID=A0A7K0J6X1_9ACTN|nr:hypothetical protein [Cutibacterium porci]MSS45710.1 hypothetical protein [Cutibacterium porci]